MNRQAECETYQGVVVPESALLRVEKKSLYGSVPGLEDDELASPDELERQAMRAEWGPILQLPVAGRRECFRPDVDEDGYVVGAFATVDFERLSPAFDKARYKADKLREQRKDVLIMFGILKERLPGKAKYAVLRRLGVGVIELGQIPDFDMYQLGVLYLRALSLGKQIVELEEASWRRRQQSHQEWLDSLG